MKDKATFKITSRFYIIYGDYEPIYVGYTNRTVRQRFMEHKRDKDFSEYDNVEVKELVDEKLSFNFTWDYEQTCRNANKVSNREADLVRKFNTQDNIFQKADGGGQAWAIEKWFVKSNKDNPKFIGLSGYEIKAYLKEEKTVTAWLGSFVGNMNPAEEVWLQNFVVDMKPGEEVWLNNFVGRMKPIEEIWLNGFVGNMNPIEEVWLGHFVGHMKSIEDIWLNGFVGGMKPVEERWLGHFVGHMNPVEEFWLGGFVGNMKPGEEVWLGSFVSTMKPEEEVWLNSFVSHIKPIEEVWVNSFVGTMIPPEELWLHNFTNHMKNKRRYL